MKGNVSVNPIFTSLNIHRPTIHSCIPIVASDHHRLHFNSKSIAWDITKTIINCTYSKQYQCLLLLCDDWKLYVYNNQFEEVARLLNWESRYTVGFQLLEQLGIMIMVGVSQVEIVKVNIITNIKKTKFLSSVKFAIQRKQQIKQPVKSKLKWNKGYFYCIQSNLLIIWSLQDLNFYSLNKLQTKGQIRNLVKKQQPITCVYYNRSYRYTVTGLITGNLKVWRLPLILLSSLKPSNEYILIHNCIYHTKQVQKIVVASDDRVIMSQAADLTVCMWSLQTFQLLRVYNFQDQYTKVLLYDYHGALVVKDHYLGDLKFGKTMEFITELNSRILSHHKNYDHLLSLTNNGGLNNRIVQTQLTLASNMGLQIKSQLLKQKDLNKISIDLFYPPLKSQQILQVIPCPFMQNRYYLLSQTGKIFKCRIQNSSSLIEYSYSINLTHDIENHPLNQLPTFIKFAYIVPEEYDSQIVQTGMQKRHGRKTNVSMTQEFINKRLITVGCDKGSIVFLPIDNMDRIFTRITYHREAIISIQTVYCSQISNSYLISICKQSFMRFIKFQQQKATCFRTIFLDFSLNFIHAFDNSLAVVMNNGLFQIMTFQTQELKAIQNYDSVDHQGDILALDVDLERQILLTAATDNKIKIWTYYKIQLYQIFLDQGLKYALFSNDYQIIVTHNQKLLYIRDLPFSITKQQLDSYNNEFLDKNSNNILTIAELISKKTNAKRSSIQKNEFQEMNIYNEYENIKLVLSQKKNKKKQIKQGVSQQKSLFSTFTDKKLLSPRKATKSVLYKKSHSMMKQPIHQNQSQGTSQNASILLTKKHLLQMGNLKKEINKPLLPKIKPKNDDIFDQFMKQKLLSKKVLNRRDITLNRIIMKNIVKDNIGDTDNIVGLKLEF